MNARTQHGWQLPSRDGVAKYLTEPRAAILRELWDPDGRSRATEEVVVEAMTDADPEASLASELEVLTAWRLVEEGGVLNDAHGRHRRFSLTGRGEQVMERHGGEIDPSALIPPEDRTTDDWREYPVPMERKFAELAELVGKLQNQIDEQRE